MLLSYCLTNCYDIVLFEKAFDLFSLKTILLVIMSWHLPVENKNQHRIKQQKREHKKFSPQNHDV